MERLGSRMIYRLLSLEPAYERCPWICSTPSAKKSNLTVSVRSRTTDRMPDRRPGRFLFMRRSAGFGLLSLDGAGEIGRLLICRLHMTCPLPLELDCQTKIA